MPSPRLPPVDVVVPVFNEAALVRGKIRDLAGIDYPRELLRFFLVDGDSTDDTVARTRSSAVEFGVDVRILAAARSGKPAQLEAGASMAASDWVLVTDADARMTPDVLRSLVEQALAAPDVHVVGTPVAAAGAHPLDEWHWRVSNALRRFEFRGGSAGLVVGPCYLARRELLLDMPGDVVADDLFVTCQAAISGGRAAVAAAPVVELRSPQSNRAWLRHKRRRGVGYLREVLRFLPRVGRMHRAARRAFLLRFGLLAALPVGLAVAGMAALAWARAHPAGAGVAAALGGVAAVVYRLSSGRVRRPLAALAFVPALAVAVTATWMSYPFSRATASYPKVSLSPEEL